VAPGGDKSCLLQRGMPMELLLLLLLQLLLLLY
jgi:hypothetical protein